MKKTISAFLLTVRTLSAQATQAPNPAQQATGNVAAAGSVPIYRVTVVARSMKAINYNHRRGSTEIGFRGTALMPAATGEAKVESKQGVIKINADMQKLEPATKFGPEYLTYVMWAITPEGRATNVGEILLNGGKSKLDATTELQSFGLIVTAEPYFAVTQPSDVVVMENFVRRETTGTIEELDAKFELLQRGQYTLNVNPAEIKPLVLDRKVPLELYEARNAVQIARWTGAERYAADTYQKAVNGLINAEGYLKGKSGSKPIGTVAREAVQMAEDARIITVKKIEGEVLANERQSGVEREALAESARADAERETRRITEQAAMSEAVALLVQFNTILQTRDTARGLIVNMADVLFDTGKYTLRAGAREKLARVAGILAGHPGLQRQVEGYTDSVGSEASNQQLSERRATSVRDYLTNAGIPTASVTAKGLGETLPVATNDTASGRQQNRRVRTGVLG